MEILAHRGYWRAAADKNSRAALARALSGGYGVETDLRDHCGQIVVSHDPIGNARAKVLNLEALLKIDRKNAGCLALNIKADGLAALVARSLKKARANNYFCFDMSIPETLKYLRAGLRCYARQSEHERVPALYARARGVWMDQFDSDWIKPDDVRAHLRRGKSAALVSPELHGRGHLAFWRRLRAADMHRQNGVALCTDYPDEAREFFQGANA